MNAPTASGSDLKALDERAVSALESGDPEALARFEREMGLSPTYVHAEFEAGRLQGLQFLLALNAPSPNRTLQPKHPAYEVGEEILINPEFQDKGDDKYRWIVLEDRDDRLLIRAEGTGLTFPPSSTVTKDMISKMPPVSLTISHEENAASPSDGSIVQARRELQEKTPAVNDGRSVALAATTLTFSLPIDFGKGWEYSNAILYGASHAWAGSYNKTESENFAHEALMLLPEIESSYLHVGLNCNVDCKVTALSDVAAIMGRLQAVVDAFSVRPEREISVRGSNFYDCKVTEYDPNDPEIEVVSNMPYLSYLAKYVPLAEQRPALCQLDLDALRAKADEHQSAKQVVKDDSPSPGM